MFKPFDLSRIPTSTKKRVILIASIVLLLVIAGEIFQKIRDNKIKNHLATARGMCTDCTKSVKSASIHIDYNFKIGTKVFSDIDGISSSNIVDCQCLKNKEIQIVYDSLNPKNSRVLLTRNGFRKFNLIAPDSMPCVLNYLKYHTEDYE